MKHRDGWWVFGYVVSWIIALVLVFAGVGKIIGFDSVVQAFQTWGLNDYRVIIGVVEIILGVLLVIPATSMIAGYIISAYFGGAIATHLVHGETAFAFVPFLILIIIWVIMFLRKPGCFSGD